MGLLSTLIDDISNSNSINNNFNMDSAPAKHQPEASKTPIGFPSLPNISNRQQYELSKR